MRNRFLVSYDICDQKRLRRVFKTMRGFGDALQYSVFLCDLSPSERIILLEKLTLIINHREGQVMLSNCCKVRGSFQATS